VYLSFFDGGSTQFTFSKTLSPRALQRDLIFAGPEMILSALFSIRSPNGVVQY
jgi:hypothetical protein